MIAVAVRGVRHRPGGFVATFLSAFLGAGLLMAFGSLFDAAAGADPASAESLTTTAGIGGGWCLVIVAFAVTSTLSLSIRQRAEQMTLLRRIGATGPQLRRMVVGEAAVVALAASVAAIPFGAVLGRVLLGLLRDTGQVAPGVDAVLGPIAWGAGFGVTLLGSVVAAVAANRRTAKADFGSKRDRPRARRLTAILFLVVGANCAVLTATIMDGKGIDAMQTAGQAGIWASIGVALLAPELLHLVTAVLAPVVRRFGAAGELAVLGVRQFGAAGEQGPVRGRRFGAAGERAVLGGRSGRVLAVRWGGGRVLAGAVMPVVMFTGIATGTVYMQAVENRASLGQAEPDYAQDVRTLNYVVVGMITLFVAVMLINTLIAATTARRREFAQQRLAGSTRGQLLAMVALEGLLVTVTGVLGGAAAALFTIVPFTSARIGRLWPSEDPFAFATVVLIAVTLTAAAMLGTTRRATREPAVTAVRA